MRNLAYRQLCLYEYPPYSTQPANDGAIYAITINAAAWPQMNCIYFPNALWLVMVIWVVPALSGLDVGVMMAAAARAQVFQDANLTAGLVILPIIARFYAQIGGALVLNVTIILLIGLMVFLLTSLLIWLVSKNFHRN